MSEIGHYHVVVNGIDWMVFPGYQPEVLGFLPTFLDAADNDDPEVQIDKRYQHGGGWAPFVGFKFADIGEPPYISVQYPGDPPLRPIACARLRDEIIVLWSGSWVSVHEDIPGADVVVARVD